MNSISINNGKITIKVGIFLFKEDNCYIAYCPSLDLSGYDVTEKKAKDDFEYVLKDWLKSQMDNKTLKQDLMAHGWKLTEEGGREPLLEDIPNRKTINKVVNLPEYIKSSVYTQLQYC